MEPGKAGGPERRRESGDDQSASGAPAKMMTFGMQGYLDRIRSGSGGGCVSVGDGSGLGEMLVGRGVADEVLRGTRTWRCGVPGRLEIAG